MEKGAANVENWPKRPEDLLKARYEAFVTGDVDFVLETHHPETRDQVDRSAVANWSKNSRWRGIDVHDVKEDGDSCKIHFTVFYDRKHESIPHTESAEFRKHEGRWFYFDSEFPKPETVRRSGEKFSPNAPCHCGSGKKYKKCHALQDSQ